MRGQLEDHFEWKGSFLLYKVDIKLEKCIRSGQMLELELELELDEVVNGYLEIPLVDSLNIDGCAELELEAELELDKEVL